MVSGKGQGQAARLGVGVGVGVSVRVLGLDMLRCLPPYIPPGMPPGEGFGFLGLVSVVRVRISLRFKGQGVSVYKARVP